MGPGPVVVNGTKLGGGGGSGIGLYIGIGLPPPVPTPAPLPEPPAPPPLGSMQEFGGGDALHRPECCMTPSVRSPQAFGADQHCEPALEELLGVTQEAAPGFGTVTYCEPTGLHG